MTPQYVRNLRLLALHAVIEEPSDYTLRKIMRWYSHEYHTPLDAVENLPLEDILQHWFETNYEDCNEEGIQTEIDRLLVTDDKLAETRRQEDAEDADQWEFGREAAAAEAAKKASQQTSPLAGIQEELRMPLPETTITAPALPPDVHMTFDDIDGFSDADALGPPSKK